MIISIYLFNLQLQNIIDIRHVGSFGKQWLLFEIKDYIVQIY